MQRFFTFLFVTLSLAQLSTQYAIKPLSPPDNIEFTALAKKDQSGKYAAEWQVSDTADTLPDNAKLQVRTTVSESNGKKTLILHAIYAGNRPTLTERNSLELSESVEREKPTKPIPPRKHSSGYTLDVHSSSSGDIPTGYEHFPGIGYYKFYTEGEKTWSTAKERCEKDGAHLAIVNSDAEMEVLKGMYAKYPNINDFAYLGFNDLEEEGKFVTIFGVPLGEAGYEKWLDGEPNQMYGEEDCGTMLRDGSLNDSPCELIFKMPFFCEYEPPEAENEDIDLDDLIL